MVEHGRLGRSRPPVRRGCLILDSKSTRFGRPEERSRARFTLVRDRSDLSAPSITRNESYIHLIARIHADIFITISTSVYFPGDGTIQVDIHSISDSAKNVIMNELADGERILYLEQPIPREKLPLLAYLPFFIAVPWSAFLVFWIVGFLGLLDQPRAANIQAPSGGERIFVIVFCIPFVAIAITFLSSPIWIRRRLRKIASKTFYLVTDRRAVIFDGGYHGDDGMTIAYETLQPKFVRKNDIRSYPLNKLGSIRKILNDDGSGDLIFGEPLFTIAIFLIREIHRDGFYSIPNVVEAERLLTTEVHAAATPA